MMLTLSAPAFAPVLPRSDDPEAQFLAACPPALRSRVTAVLTNPRLGGRGLRMWLALFTRTGEPVPVQLPPEVLQVYLEDDEAEPMCDCEDCGLAIPARPSSRYGHEPEVEHVYFSSCPACQGRTGVNAYCVRNAML